MTTVSRRVVTRFAPSPTGFLHIGGARTALFNWLFAQRHGGDFVLRIEDTDRARYSEEAVDAILDGLTWLGLHWQGDAISQHSRRERHAEVAEGLLRDGHAYRCYAQPTELQALREKARAEGSVFRADIWRDKDPADAPRDLKPVIRLKMPRDGETRIADAVQGEVTVSNATLDDMVLLRADGSPTYMLAVVVDDHDFGVSHVIRGDDHLNNAFRQQQVYQALGWTAPGMAHIPLIHGADGKKLSKRHGALGVDAYREMGYLADALCNYLLRLGWSLGDQEIITRDEAIRHFDLAVVNKGAARFDFDKLAHINAQYLRQLDAADLVALLRPHVRKAYSIELTEADDARLAKAMPDMTQRAQTLAELCALVPIYCHQTPLPYTDKARKSLTDNRETLDAVAEALDGADFDDPAALKEILGETSSRLGLKLGQVMQPIRAALTGGLPAGDLSELLSIIGRDMCMQRLSGAGSPKA